MNLLKTSAPALLLVLAAFSPIQLAADFRVGEGMQEIDGEVDDDVYVAGEQVLVTGEVTGDVAAAARTIQMEGTTGGSLFAGAETVEISGSVGNSARVGARVLNVSGSTGGDLLTGAQSVTVEPSATIGRDLIGGVQTLRIDGDVAGDVKAAAQTVRISGSVGGDVDVEANEVILADGARIGGDLTYTSSNKADIDPGAQVSGRIQRRVPVRPDPGSPVTDYLVSFFRAVGGALALGLVALWLTPRLLPALAGTLRRAPWVSLGIGLGAGIAVPPAAIFLFVLAAIVGAGFSISLLMLGTAVALLMLAKATAGYLLGAWLLTRRSPELDLPFRKAALALLTGIVILAAVGIVPVLGGIVDFFIGITVLGAGVITLVQHRRPPRGQEPPDTAETAPVAT